MKDSLMNIIRDERKKKYVLFVSTLIIFIVVLLSVIFVRTQVSTRGRAAGPSCSWGYNMCQFKYIVTGDKGAGYKVWLTDKALPEGQIIIKENGLPAESGGTLGSTQGNEATKVISFEGIPMGLEEIHCNVEVWPLMCNDTRGETQFGEAVNYCPITEDSPTPPEFTPTPTPDGGGEVLCNNCSKVELDINLDPPPPDLTPPNADEVGLKYGRVKLRIVDNACNKDEIKCAEIDENGNVKKSGLKIEFTAFNSDSCDDDNDIISPIPRNKDNLLLSCQDAKTDEGARFRLHQALGDACRCYQLRSEYVVAPGDESIVPQLCPNQEKLSVCCPSCQPPEIIDLADDDVGHGGDIDGCPGDPDGPRPNDTPICTFEIISPANACLNINQTSTIETHDGYNNGKIDFDDDFREQDNKGNKTRQPVGSGDQRVQYEYIDGGVYDIRLECKDVDDNIQATCTKRIRTTCKAPPDGGPTPTNRPTPNTPPPGDGVCFDECTSNADCGTGMTCENVQGTNRCVRNNNPECGDDQQCWCEPPVCQEISVSAICQ